MINSTIDEEARVRIGIIGTGGIAQGHIRRIIAHPHGEVTAICDIVPEQMEKTVERHPQIAEVPRFTRYEDMIESGLVEAVVICTPHTTHFDQIMNSLDQGLHVLSEKPMVCKVKDAHTVIRRVHETDKVFVLNYQRHYQPEFLYIREAIKAGTYGKVQFVQGLQCQGWLKGCAGSWRHDPALSGGGQLNDLVHLLAVLLFVTNLPVTEVTGFIDNLSVPVDINSALSIKFEGGAQGNLTIVGNAPTWHEDITIWCENGIFFKRNGHLEVCDGEGKRFTPTLDQMPAGSDPDVNFINAVLGKEPIGVPAYWGLRVIELTEAAWRSARTHAVAAVERG